MAFENAQVYGTGSNSSIGATQMNTKYYEKKALIELAKETYFGQLADTISMPKHMGKTIKRYHYLPLLDDANINDQGIDANGVGSDDTSYECSVAVTMSDGSIPRIPPYYGRSVDNKVYFTGIGTNGAAAETNCIAKLISWCTADVEGGGRATACIDAAAFAVLMTAGGALFDAGFRFTDKAGNTLTVLTGLDALAVPHSGNLYGSSKDIGAISDKLPVISETGGRINRVGFKRFEINGTIAKFGFFDEYTQESLDFDSDDQLEEHINREMLRGANEITEDALQIDLINAAGVVRYGSNTVTSTAGVTSAPTGTATTVAQMSGVAASCTEVSYTDIMKLSIDLDNNRCPKSTKVITGSRMVDTKVVNAGRVMFIGSELQPTLERLNDYHGNQAFIPVAHYADAGTVVNGEIGTIGNFRIVVVPEMLHKAGVGIAEDVNAGYRVTDGKYDAYPMLVVGSEAFTTIGFQTDGKSSKFKIFHKKPGESTADRNDPYGETGFMSIKWYYGFMPLRSERIAVLWSVARW